MQIEGNEDQRTLQEKSKVLLCTIISIVISDKQF